MKLIELTFCTTRSGTIKKTVINAEHIVCMTEYSIDGVHSSTKIDFVVPLSQRLEVEETIPEILQKIEESSF